MRQSLKGMGLWGLGVLAVTCAGCILSGFPVEESNSAPPVTSSPAPVTGSPTALEPDTPVRTPDPAVGAILLDADVKIPDVFVVAQADPDSIVRVFYHAGSNSAEEFRAYVDARVAGVTEVRWEDSGYAPSEWAAVGREVMDEAREAGVSPSGGYLDHETFEYVLFVREITAEVEFAERFLGGRELTVRMVASPEDGPE